MFQLSSFSSSFFSFFFGLELNLASKISSLANKYLKKITLELFTSISGISTIDIALFPGKFGDDLRYLTKK